MSAQRRINGKTEWKTDNLAILSGSGLFPEDEGGRANITPHELGLVTGTMSMSDIYPAMEVASPELSSAMRVLPKAIEWADVANEALGAGELIRSDDAMIHLHSLVPELYCCRKLGDGFGAVVGAVWNSFDGQRGVPMDRSQIQSIRLALSGIQAQPNLTFERALDLISDLERAGLDIHPAGFEALAQLLNE